MYYNKYEGERIYLSPINPDDYKIFTKWLNDESLACGLGTFSMMTTESSEKDWLDNVSKRGMHNFAIIKKENNELLGTYGLEIKDANSKRFHIGGFIGEKENRGQGYGTEALKLVTKYAFEILNAESIFSGIYDFNEASLKSAKKVGYIVAGKYRNSYFYNGKYNDEYCIEITREDYINKK